MYLLQQGWWEWTSACIVLHFKRLVKYLGTILFVCFCCFLLYSCCCVLFFPVVPDFCWKQTNTSPPTLCVSLFISLLKMSGSSCPSFSFSYFSSPLFSVFMLENMTMLREGTDAGDCLGKWTRSSPFRQDDKWIRGVSVCVCTFVCLL